MLTLFLLLAVGYSSTSTCPTGFQKADTSCYLRNETQVTWEEAYQFCIDVDEGANLAIVDDSTENAVLAAAWTATTLGDAGGWFWIAGTDAGWKMRDGTYVDYDTDDLTHFVGGSLNGANMGAGTNYDYVRFSLSTNQWDFVTEADKYAFVCEIPLDTCYTSLDLTQSNGGLYRTVWPTASIDTTETLSCPTGYSNTQDRLCGSDAQYDTPDVSRCAAIIGTSGYTDDTTTDGFGWNYNTKVDSGSHGPFEDGDDNTKNFDVKDVDPVAYPYLYITFTVTGHGAFDGTVDISVNGTTVESQAVGTGEYTYESTVGREQFGLTDTFDLTIGATMAGGASTDYVTFNGLEIHPYSRQQMSENCYREYGYNESTSYPNFVQANSGFLSEADDLTIEFNLPRELYDVQIEFVGQTEDDIIGYSDSIAATSHWGSSRETSSNARCGSETWSAALPWTSLSDVFTSIENFNDGTALVTNENQDYYVFEAELNITATEKIVAHAENSPRTWTLIRETTWRYPFALKWRRDISIDTQLTVHVCDDTHTICTIRHVAAIVSFVQTHVNPIAELGGESIGTVVLGIKTLVAYPYMFVSGRASDDPPNDQISGSSITDYTAKYSTWDPPVVTAVTDTMTWDGKTVQSVVDTDMQFQWENTESCSHNATEAVNFQTDKECEQNWSLELKPQAGSCFVNGNYTISWSARCMYDKPVCVFLKSAGVYQNGVQTTLQVKSTQMCPSLVQDVDIDGYLCSAGRSADNEGYTTGCDADPTYVQGEETHFITEISSTLATIVKTEIIEIKSTQDYDSWNTASAANAGLLPRFDTDFDNTVSLWDETKSISTSTDWPEFDDGETPAIGNRQVIMEVQNSDTTDHTFADNFAGFIVKLDPYIFPAPHDRSADIIFTVVLRVTYQGFDDFGRTEGVLSGDDFGGNNDYSWCAGVRADFNDEAAGASESDITTLFCTEYDEACSKCPDTCGAEATCARRNLKTAIVEKQVRRRLRTVIEDGEDQSSFSTQIALEPSIAEITGHVDSSSKAVKFTLMMTVNEQMLNTFNYDRPHFYRTMEYELSRLSGAANGQQLQCKQISLVTKEDEDALRVVVEISKLNVPEEDLLPYKIAQNLELSIQTGTIYGTNFFHTSEVYSMEYHAVDDTPNKVHFGHVNPISSETDYESDSVKAVSLLLAFASLFLMW